MDMGKGTRLFTSECVSMGHPDKVADQISDAILDGMLAADPNSRVACETMVKTGMAVIAGEVKTEGYVDIPAIVRQTIKEIGYCHSDIGFDYETCAVLTAIEGQSEDISIGVDREGAGDQGIMFGYACNDTPEFMPMPMMLARNLLNKSAELRESGAVDYLRPDGKSQVTIEYYDGVPKRVHTIVLSHHHTPSIMMDQLRNEFKEKIIKAVIPSNLLDADTIYHINPTGRFEKGGPYADCGLTGRKIIVDTYGGMARHGGGAFSGKDPTKVDRSAAYAARYAAKNIVAAGLCAKCEIQLSYAIGVSEPLSIRVDTFGTAVVDEQKIETVVRELFDFTPAGMIKRLKLRRPIYKNLARYGHFGINDESRTWEHLDMVKELKKAVGL